MNVAVVGAGVAGLRTAQLLERSGVQVTVFEARNRVGGRMWTASVGQAEFEAGAEWIDVEQDRVFALLQEFGLEPLPSDPRPRRNHFCGQVIEKPSAKLDMGEGTSLKDLLDRAASTSTERAYLEAVALSDEGTDSDRVDLAEWKRFSTNYAARGEPEHGMSAFRFPESTSAICGRMARSIKGDVCLNAELTAIRDSFGVQLKFVDGSKETFDEVVLAVPPTCLTRLKYDGERIWEGVEMTPTCKIALLFDRPFWEGDGWNGHLMSDLDVQQVWPCGKALVCYINGRGMERLVKQADPIDEALEALSLIAPRAQRHFIEGKLVDWSADLFAGGGFPYVSPGSKRQTPSNEGPVRFAGDWTASWIGFVEGALESAERVVEEFKNEHGLS